MSYSDIVLNGKTYAGIGSGPNSFVRGVTASTLPASNRNMQLTISHSSGKGNKPNRHLVKLSTEWLNSTTGIWIPMSVHVVMTLPNDGIAQSTMATYMDFLGTLLGGDLYDLLTVAGTGAALANGEFL